MFADSVRAFPMDRASIRRLAQQHADAGEPMQQALFPSTTDQLAYEHAYIERDRDLAYECALA